MTTDHQLANLRQRELKLSRIRKEILAQDSETALDMILDAPSPAGLVQSFPDEDLYYLLNHIGGADFLPALALATSSQWEYIMDMEVWDGDRMDTPMMTQALGLLYKADPQRLLRWIITEKPGFFEHYLYNNMAVVVREHDELPPEDHTDYVTIDDKFYFRFPRVKHRDDPQGEAPEENQDDGETDEAEASAELIEQMVKKVAEMDLSVFHGLLLETVSILPAEVEEEEFRLKNVRLAEKGFLPRHEAVGIYQPTPVENLRQRPETTGPTEETFDPEHPLPPQCFSQHIKGENRFIKALAHVRPDLKLQLESELAALVNKVISADQVKIRDKKILEEVLAQTTAYLSLGMEIIANEDGRADTSQEENALTLETYFLEDIFRTGSRAGILLKQTAMTWQGQSFISTLNLPLSFLGEEYLGLLGGLFLERPRAFDNYRTTKEIYAHFSSLEQVEATRRGLDEIMVLDRFLAALDPDIATFTKGVLTYKSLILSLWARERMELEASLAPIPMDRFTPFFKALYHAGNQETLDAFKRRDFLNWALEILKGMGEMEMEALPQPLDALLNSLLDEVSDEYAPIQKPDARFMPHFLLEAQ